MFKKAVFAFHNMGMRTRLLKTCALPMAAMALLSACAYTGNSDIENPLVRKTGWFSYLNADDLRVACSAGEAEGRIRLIYNADYYTETRSYELAPVVGAPQFNMVSRIFGPLDVSNINVQLSAPLGAFGGNATTATLSRDQYLSITDALQADGFGYQNRDGLRLNSDDYYWIAIGCSNHNITLAAWTQAKEDMRNLKFPAVVDGLSGLPRPLPVPPEFGVARLPDPVFSPNDDRSESRQFYRTVRGNQIR